MVSDLINITGGLSGFILSKYMHKSTNFPLPSKLNNIYNSINDSFFKFLIIIFQHSGHSPFILDKGAVPLNNGNLLIRIYRRSKISIN